MQVQLKETERLTCIPYDPVLRGDGHDNFGYVDLKREPAKIDVIPELRDCPELKRFVQALNHPRSLFKTVGCDKYWDPIDDPTYKFLRTSFVTVVFERLDWNTKERFVRLYREFDAGTVHEQVSISDATIVEVEIQRIISEIEEFSAKKMHGSGLAIWIKGWGRTQEEALHRWKSGVEVTQKVFTTWIPPNSTEWLVPSEIG